MTRTLVLMRHAAAEGWSVSGDRGRKLNEGGRQDAAQAGQQMAALGIQHVLCSTATRTRETVECLGLDAPVEYMDALYNCTMDTLVQRIGEIEDDVTALLVVAHSPAIPSLAAELTWAADPSAADDMRCWFPTAAFSQFTLEGSWSELTDDATLKLAGIKRVGH
ncbi:phosphohistidine phosphatase [Luteococcus japonicus]|uniref:Phosphohistidine phosphatase SixA n=2 Tax=Luteococcus japonicus TaxID=33984 RepID=A0A1R4ID70_9ACTN|nr:MULTISPECIES: histidine phosphatase family protein [Luteococcus]MDN5563714.1 histidine phosphatase family protein [Luteococcus sp.]ROR54334.1 phosphohistidine phosphatase [Luteococcus japonicus]SJN17534.1 Phosphohistidine phosphatase SixA [Luteococcus japonicus LSP_Lj1]